ncbi:MAG: hypothetical protein CL859_02555 [Cyanobium sp. ARS6]|nr:hypothetical protein [Cyanobium sp. ARS6]
MLIAEASMKPMGLLLDSGVNKDLSSRLQKVHQVGSENRFLFDAAELPTRCRFEGVLDEVHPANPELMYLKASKVQS